MENNNQMHEDDRAVGDKDNEDEETVGDKNKKDEETDVDKKDKEDDGDFGDKDKEEWYVCRLCMENSTSRIGKVYTQFESENYWICDECSSTFQTGYKVTNIEQSEESGSASPFTCDVCGEGFASVEKLFDHATQHSVSSVSSGGSFNSPTYLEDESWSTSEDAK